MARRPGRSALRGIGLRGRHGAAGGRNGGSAAEPGGPDRRKRLRAESARGEIRVAVDGRGLSCATSARHTWTLGPRLISTRGGRGDRTAAAGCCPGRGATDVRGDLVAAGTRDDQGASCRDEPGGKNRHAGQLPATARLACVPRALRQVAAAGLAGGRARQALRRLGGEDRLDLDGQLVGHRPGRTRWRAWRARRPPPCSAPCSGHSRPHGPGSSRPCVASARRDPGWQAPQRLHDGSWCFVTPLLRR